MKKDEKYRCLSPFASFLRKTLSNVLNPSWWSFEWRYWIRRTPWDTSITPPEVMAFLSTAKPGRALDLGCGTGTNAITMAKHGWQVTGVDFSPKAIRSARNKAGRVGLMIDFRVGDVADLHDLSCPYDYALDIGCLFTLREEHRGPYAAGLERLLRPGSPFMLYAWLPRQHRGRPRGMTPEEVKALFRDRFELTRIEFGEEKSGRSAWYWFIKRSDPIESESASSEEGGE